MLRKNNNLLLVLSAVLSVLGFVPAKSMALPSAPTGLTASVSNGVVTLQWNSDLSPIPTVVAYSIARVLQDITSSPTPTPTGILTPTATPAAIATVMAPTPVFQDFQVTNGRNYLYQVSALDLTGMSPPAMISGEPFSIPAAVQPVVVQSIHSGSLDLSWGIPLSSYPVSIYQVYRYDYFGPNTPTPFPSATVTPTITAIPVTAWVPVGTPVALVSGNSYVDSSPGSSGALAVYYALVALDDRGNQGLLPLNSTNPGLPKNNLAPVAPVLSGILSATATPNAYGIHLLWNGSVPSEGVAAYQVFSGSIPLTTIGVVVPSPTYSYDDPTIPFAASASVSYKVVAVNANGGSNSNILVKNISKSSVPNPILVTPNPTQGVTVVWNTGFGGTYGLSGYRVYKSQNGVPVSVAVSQPGSPTPTGSSTPTITPTPFATVTVVPSAVSTLVVVDTVNTNAHRWSYWVEPYDLLGLGGNIGIAPTPSYLNLAPTFVATVLATPVPGTNNQIHIFWSGAAEGFYGLPFNFVVYRDEFFTPTATPILTFTPSPFSPTPTWTPTPVAVLPSNQNFFDDFVAGGVGTTVVYKVQVVDSKGNTSAISYSSNPIPLTGSVVPATPLPRPVSGSENTMVYSWGNNPASDSVDSYYVYGSDYLTVTPVVTPITIILPTPTVVSFSSPATPWNASSVFVQAHNSSGFSPAVEISGISVPTYQVTAVMTPGARQVEVSWNMTPLLAASTPEINYFGVYRSTSPGANFTPIASVTVSSSSYVDSALLSGKTYYYRVTARGNGGGVTAESPLYPTMAPTPEGNCQTWPSLPSGVTVVSDVNQTTIAWAANPAPETILSYLVLHNGTPTMTVTPSSPLSLVFPETQGAASSYEVVAQNAQGPSDQTGTVSVLPPPAMTLTVEVTPQQTVLISGLNYSGSVSNYSVYRSIDPAFNPVSVSFVGNISDPVSALNDFNPVPGYVNYYKAIAGNGLGLSALPTLVPAAPLTLWPNAPVFNLSSGSGAVTAQWAAPVGNVPVTAYNLFRNFYPTMTPVFLAQTGPTTTSYSDSGVTTGGAYLYWLNAENGNGASAFSAPQTIIPLQPPALSITPLAGKNVLSWSPVTVLPSSAVTGYMVYRTIPTPGATPTFVPISGLLRGVTVTSYTDANVFDSVTYIYKVAATTLNNLLSDFSNPMTVTVAPMPVTNLTAVSGDGIVQLRWSYGGVPNANYLIQRKLGSASDSDYQTIKTGVVGLNYLDSGLLDKTFYVYRMITIDAQGLTAVSASAAALPAKAPLLPLPAAVTLTQNSDSAQTLIGNTLTWEGANQSGFDAATMYPLGGYVVYRSTDGGGVYDLSGGQPAVVPVTMANGIPATPVTFFDTVQLVGGPTYTYLVQAFDAPPDLPSSTTSNITQGLVHTANYNLVTAYPVGSNTALDRNAIRPFGTSKEQTVNIRFVSSAQGRINIKVYSLNGTFVKELVNDDYAPGIHWKSWDATNMNGSLVASGVYLISTESPGGHQEFQKVAVIK